MQADEFEKKIQSKMEGFELVPAGEVWKQVATKIKKEKKKRRILIYWLFTGFVLLSVITGYWFTNNENNRNLVTNNFDNNIDNSSPKENYKIKQDSHDFSRHFNKVQKVQAPKSIAFLKKGVIKSVVNSVNTNNFFTKITNVKVRNEELNINREKDNRKEYKAEKQIAGSLPPHKFYNPKLAATEKVHTAFKNNSVIDGKTNFTKDASINTIVKKIIRTNKKWNLDFTVYGGISDNLSGLPLLEKSYAQDYYASPNSLQSGSYSYYININALNNFKSRLSFGLGVSAKKQLTKRISLSGGVDYHLYSAKSAVGNKVIQQRSFYDSIYQNTTYVNSYYTISNASKYSNKYQLVELPINLQFQLNRNHEQPLLFSAGITPGYLVSSNALYANPSENVYYVDKQRFHQFQLSAQTGFSFPIIASQKYSLHAGPVVQYGFTNVATTVTKADQHLFFTGIKADIIF